MLIGIDLTCFVNFQSFIRSVKSMHFLFVLYSSGVPDLLSPLLTAALSPLAGHRGSYDAIYLLFVSKLGLASLAAAVGWFFMGSSASDGGSNSVEMTMTMMALFVCASRTLTATTFSFFNMSVSDIIDEDYHKVKRFLCEFHIDFILTMHHSILS
jgi:hypothetical protein